MNRFLFASALSALVLACSCTQPSTEPQPNNNGKDDTPPVKLDIKITTEQAYSITTTSATVSATYEGAVTEIRDRGFMYGLSATALDQTSGLNSTTESSGQFSATLSSLEPDQTYYYKAYITVWSNEENKYVDFCGEVLNFKTNAEEKPVAKGLAYLGCYEMPSIALADQLSYSNSGTETFGSTKWYNFETTNQNQVVVTHTYSYENKTYRNWTALIDKDKQSPLWSAFVMHSEAYPDNEVGRYDKKGGKWTLDPAIPESWQRSVASSNFSRGHFCASEYRQTVLNSANAQTFYYTNQTLQWQNKFNDGIWATLEQAVSANAPSGRDTLYVVVGALFEDPNNIISTNQGTQAIAATHFYKCLMKCSFDVDGSMTAARGCAYIFTNESQSGSYSKGITSIDAIEQRSGWDFFTNVPKDLQDAAEQMSTSLW